jgi:hypothetical protein
VKLPCQKKRPSPQKQARPGFYVLACESFSLQFVYDSQVQSQPSAQLSQQPLSQLQSGQPSQQPLSLQQPVVGAAAGPVEAKDRAPAERAAKAANDQRALVNMVELTFWLNI